jgi:hypothetical protein
MLPIIDLKLTFLNEFSCISELPLESINITLRMGDGLKNIICCFSNLA